MEPQDPTQTPQQPTQPAPASPPDGSGPPTAGSPPPTPGPSPAPPAAQPSVDDLLAQVRLSTPPDNARNKMMLIMAGGLILLVVAASIALSILGHKTKPRAITAPASQNSSAPQSSNSVVSSEQQKARNSKRQSDLASLQTQLEAFFSQNGYYPSLTDMNSASWRAANMKSLNTNAMIDPSSTGQNPALTATPAAKEYAYHVTNAAGQSCESDDTKCAKYTLTATYEGTVDGATTLTKTNLD